MHVPESAERSQITGIDFSFCFYETCNYVECAVYGIWIISREKMENIVCLHICYLQDLTAP